MLRRIKNKLRIGVSAKPQGIDGIQKLGHRAYVGGKWEEIGQLQFTYIKEQGLKPDDCLLDIACGSLRAGVHFIAYLEPGNYLGIEKEEELIRLGVEKELGETLNAEKRPEFVISNAFEFAKFSKKADYAIAQSLFTHLPPSLINLCFANLRQQIKPQGVFYATFHLSKTQRKNPDQSHDHDYFAYTQAEIEAFGTNNGWRAEYLGDWGHPRQQMMARYFPAD